MDGRTDVRTENLPILQDFVPYRGRCPASQRKIYANKEKQGKGIADHLMPLGDWFSWWAVIKTETLIQYSHAFTVRQRICFPQPELQRKPLRHEEATLLVQFIHYSLLMVRKANHQGEM